MLLVVEVADETTIQDLNVKAKRYGEAGYPVYWVVTEVAIYEVHGARLDGLPDARGVPPLGAHPGPVRACETLPRPFVLPPAAHPRRGLLRLPQPTGWGADRGIQRPLRPITAAEVERNLRRECGGVDEVFAVMVPAYLRDL